MDLFKRAEPLVGSDLPQQYIAIIDSEAVDLPRVDWAEIKEVTSFVDLVTPVVDKVVIWAIKDTEDWLQQLRLVADNSAVCGVQPVEVSGLTDYSPSVQSTQSFWNCPSIKFEDWVNEAQEAARSAELARRATMDRDETKKDDAMRKDGTFKKIEVTEVPDESDDMNLVL